MTKWSIAPAAILCALILVVRRLSRPQSEVPSARLDPWFWTYLGIVGAGVCFRPAAPSIGTLLDCATVLVVYKVATVHRARKSSWTPAIFLLLAGVLFICVQAHLRYVGLDLAERKGADAFLRASFVGHTEFSAFLELFIPVSVAFMIDRGRKTRWAMSLWLLFVVWTYLAAQSRGAWIAALTVLGILALADRQWLRWPGRPHRPALVIIGVALAGAIGSILSRLSAFSPERILADPRITEWMTLLRMIRAHLWTGVGPGMYRYESLGYRPPDFELWTAVGFNQILMALSEMGILILLPILMILGIMTGIIWRTVREPDSDHLKKGIALGLTIVSVHACWDRHLSIPVIAAIAAAWAGFLQPLEPSRSSSRVSNRAVTTFKNVMCSGLLILFAAGIACQAVSGYFLERAIALDPQKPLSLNQRLADLDRAVRIWPPNSLAREHKARMLLHWTLRASDPAAKVRRAKAALQAWEQAVRSNPRYCELLLETAEAKILADGGRVASDTLRILDDLVECRPDQPRCEAYSAALVFRYLGLQDAGSEAEAWAMQMTVKSLRGQPNTWKTAVGRMRRYLSLRYGGTGSEDRMIAFLADHQVQSEEILEFLKLSGYWNAYERFKMNRIGLKSSDPVSDTDQRM